ncbi:MAG: hypothetical protein JRI23_04120 [Deltaproteobacteria bacterium]|jgi:hypothetical protein|nr:hypothetical protein [Deltaproteobacteria bacterium]MBW2530713.1 hypothetical protein [Deltaproteobacteria bacterium]
MATTSVQSLPGLERIFRAFWSQTGDGSEAHRALRALVLHMVDGHAPGTFDELGLEPRLAEALVELRQLPAALEGDLTLDEAQARVDACFVRHERGSGGPKLDREQLGAMLWRLVIGGDPIHAFILGEMAALIGVDARVDVGDRPYRGVDRTEDLYWLTHVLLVASRYLAEPVRRDDFAEPVAELLQATPWVVASQQVDLAAELAICLQLVGEHRAPEHRALLALVEGRVGEDGLVRDPSAEHLWFELADHATGASLVALAGARWRRAGMRGAP